MCTWKFWLTLVVLGLKPQMESVSSLWSKDGSQFGSSKLLFPERVRFSAITIEEQVINKEKNRQRHAPYLWISVSASLLFLKWLFESSWDGLSSEVLPPGLPGGLLAKSSSLWVYADSFSMPCSPKLEALSFWIDVDFDLGEPTPFCTSIAQSLANESPERENNGQDKSQISD